MDKMLTLQCGACLSCRLRRSREWAARCMHESQMHEKTCFITLTYDDRHMPPNRSVDVAEWKVFAKALRHKLGPFRFLHCGEYGGEQGGTLRPHYHALLFGIDFREDRVEWKMRGEHQTYISKTLAKVWGKGFSEIGDLSYNSAAYVARYVVKKTTGKGAEKAYERVSEETGEIWSVKPDYATMSRNPGLGATWFAKYWKDVYPDNFIVANGKEMPPPKFYDKLLEKKDPTMFQRMKRKRINWQADKTADNTDERLRVKEEFLERSLIKQKRDLKDR